MTRVAHPSAASCSTSHPYSTPLVSNVPIRPTVAIAALLC